MDIRDFESYVQQVNWIFAKSYANKSPHWYTIKAHRPDLAETFEIALIFIRKFGADENYYGTKFVCFYFAGYKYWTMGAPVWETILINRTDMASCERFGITWKPQHGYVPREYTFPDVVTNDDMKRVFSGLPVHRPNGAGLTGQKEMDLWL